jgi:hypothetical protein
MLNFNNSSFGAFTTGSTAGAATSDAMVTCMKMKAAASKIAMLAPKDATFVERALFAAVLSPDFLSALMFVPDFVQEHSSQVPQLSVKAALRISSILFYHSFKCGIVEFGSPEYTLNKAEFAVGLDKLIAFLADSDKLSHNEVLGILTQGFPPTL